MTIVKKKISKNKRVMPNSASGALAKHVKK
jgi:hypothetical protein